MAFVVVGFAVFAQEKDGKGVVKREKQVSPRYTCKSAADQWCELARKGPYPGAVVREIMKHEG